MADRDGLVADAMTALQAALDDLLGDATVSTAIEEVRTDSVGLGGYVAPSSEPPGAIVGVRLEADIRLQPDEDGGGDGSPEEALREAVRAVLGAPRSATRDRGLLRVERIRPPGEGTPEPNAVLSVVFEHLRPPAEAEGVIEEIPKEIDVSS